MLGIRHYRNTAIDLFLGDLTEFVCDAMVNAANEALSGGGGVDDAIHRAGGPIIMEECQSIGYCPSGQAVVTSAGLLPAKIVIHTVGPIWKDGSAGESVILASAYRSSLQLASEANCPHIAFPSISTGTYGYPIEQASSVAMTAIKAFLESPHQLRRITLVLYSKEHYETYQKALFECFPEQIS